MTGRHRALGRLSARRRRPRRVAVLAGLLAVAATGAVVGGPPLIHRTSSAADSGTDLSAALAPGRLNPLPSREALRTAAVASLAGTATLTTQVMLQPNGWFCGPAATRIALTAVGQFPSVDDLAVQLGTTRAGTDSAYDVTRVMTALVPDAGYQTRSIPAYPATADQAELLRVDVMTSISKGDAVVANIAGTRTDETGQVHSYPRGHYVAIVGYRGDGADVLVADPADRVGVPSYWLPVDTMANWISTRGYTTA